MATRQNKRSKQRTGPKRYSEPDSKIANKSPSISLPRPERKFGAQHSVEFPQVKGKTTERLEFYSTADYHCITIDFEDKTSLNLEIEPGFTINAELQQRKKGERDIILEWPPIPCQK